MGSAWKSNLANEIKKVREILRERQRNALLSGDMEKQLSLYIRLELIEAIAAYSVGHKVTSKTCFKKGSLMCRVFDGTKEGRELLSDEETELCKKIRKEKITDVLMYLQRFVKATVKTSRED